MSSAIVKAERSLGWAAFFVAVAAFLVDHARSDMDGVRRELLAARDAKVDAQAAAERAKDDLDAALDRFNDREPDAPAAP